MQGRLSLVFAFVAVSTFVTGEDSSKRAPSGFLGMRGKKNLLALHPSSYDESGLRDSMKRAPSGFLGMRGKKLMSDNEFYDIGDWDKRAPLGFQGMRGKKDYYDEDEESGASYKRAPLGFQGMRGKKYYSYDTTSDEYPFDDDYEMNLYKRAPLGFQGMRGKKFMDKRAPAGFLGMRGKKEPRSFWYSRQMPYDFRGKFVAVRGKKMSEEVSGETAEDASRSLRSLLQELEKRGKPSGFVGMRGKKSSNGEILPSDNSPSRQ